MANQRNAAVEEKIKNAEKIIQSYAYGKELNQAIRYLQSHDPDNAVLASIKDFEDSIPMLKELNALYRADVARAENDTAELEKIAEFLGRKRRSKEMNDIARQMLKELPEVKADPEKGKAIEAVLNVATHKPKEIEIDPNGLSDDEIVLNAEKIDYIIGDKDFQDKIYAETIKPAKEKVTIVDEEGKAVDNADDLWVAKMMSALNEVSMTRMDDAAFAAKKVEEQREDLQEDVISCFRKDMRFMVRDTVGGADPDAAERDYHSGKNVKIKANQIFSNLENTKDKMQLKAEAFEKAGKKKSGSWLRGKLDKLNKFSKKHFGMTPVEFGKDLMGYFSRARGISNLAALGVMFGAAAVSVPAGLAGATAYALYQSFAPSQWSIYEKKQANLKAAKARGDEEAIKIWSGRAGLKHAYDAIQANPKEKERFDRQKRRNRNYGLAGAALVGLAAPVVTFGGGILAGLGLSASATALGARALSAGSRMTGANLNSYDMMKEAKQQSIEDKTEASVEGYKKARTFFGLSLFASAFAEYCMANSVADAYSAGHAMGAEYNTQNVDQLAGNTNNEQIVENNENNSNAPAVEDTPAEVTHVDWRDGISGSHVKYIEDHVQGQAAAYAKIYGWDVNPDDMDAVAQKMADNIQKGIDNGALPKDMPVGEIMYKYLRIIAWREKGEYIQGTKLIQSVMVNGEPDYWTNAAEIKALNHIIFCEEKPEVSAASIGNVLNRITASGDDLDKSLDHLTNNRYIGTADLMHKAGDVNCAHVSYWEHIKSAVKSIVNKETPKVPDEPPAEEIYEGAEQPSLEDGKVEGRTTITIKGQIYKTSSNAGWTEVDEKSVDYSKTGPRVAIPSSEVDAGPEKTDASAPGNNGDQAFTAMMKSKMGNGMV